MKELDKLKKSLGMEFAHSKAPTDKASEVETILKESQQSDIKF